MMLDRAYQLAEEIKAQLARIIELLEQLAKERDHVRH
jgi:hypothetical protein